MFCSQTLLVHNIVLKSCQDLNIYQDMCVIYTIYVQEA